jgi:hypothetical protein
VWWNGQRNRGHRVAWVLTVGEVPSGRRVIQTCGIRAVVGPTISSCIGPEMRTTRSAEPPPCAEQLRPGGRQRPTRTALTGPVATRVLQQVTYVRDSDTLLTPGGGNWKLNLCEDEVEQLHLDGQGVGARPELARDPKTVAELLKPMQAVSPGSARWIPMLSSDGSVDQGELGPALAHGFLIVRW